MKNTTLRKALYCWRYARQAVNDALRFIKAERDMKICKLIRGSKEDDTEQTNTYIDDNIHQNVQQLTKLNKPCSDFPCIDTPACLELWRCSARF